jgi:hypothetical protein
MEPLKDMYRLEASRYHEAIIILQQTIDLTDGRQRVPQLERMTVRSTRESFDMLTRFEAVIETLHVPVTKLTAFDLKTILHDGGLTYIQCGELLLNLTQTLRRELQSVKVFSLGADRAAFYEPTEPLFGPDLDKNFPSITYEIDQAGKCYACDLTTASAFHSIRTMEAGIRAMARCLGIPDPTSGKNRNWSNISRSLEQKIEANWPKSTGRMSGDAKIFDKLYGAITAMQNPYRNETMHLDAKYTAPEALHIFELVKGLMQRIASRMDENGDPKV